MYNYQEERYDTAQPWLDGSDVSKK